MWQRTPVAGHDIQDTNPDRLQRNAAVVPGEAPSAPRSPPPALSRQACEVGVRPCVHFSVAWSSPAWSLCLIVSERRKAAALLMVFLVAPGAALLPPGRAAAVQCPTCPGDCDGDGVVSVAELVAGVRTALGQTAPGCRRFGWRTSDGRPAPEVGVDCLVRAVGHALAGCPCFADPEPTDDPPAIRAIWSPEAKREALATLRVAPQWGCAELVEGNTLTTGWEDSVDISRDGRRLSFFYLPLDLLAFNEQGNSDLARLDEFRRGPDRGNRPIWVSDFFTTWFGPDGRTCRPSPFPFSRDNRFEWGGMQADDGDWYYVASGFDPDIQPDIYRNEERLPFNSPFEEDDPHYDSASRVLFFDSTDRPGAPDSGNPELKDIWVTEQTSPGHWSAPEPLPAPINLAGTDDRQAHLGPDRRLYFTSSRGSGALSIHVASPSGPGTWSDVVEILSHPPDVHPTPRGLALIAVGEPTVTAGGTLYFAAVFYHPPTNRFDLDIARAGPEVCRRRKAAGVRRFHSGP